MSGWRTRFCGADQLFLGEAADLDEIRIGVLDIAVQVGRGHDRAAIGKHGFVAGNGGIDTHARSFDDEEWMSLVV
nr:hypothetical protein [Massilia sp. YIM B02763]